MKRLILAAAVALCAPAAVAHDGAVSTGAVQAVSEAAAPAVAAVDAFHAALGSGDAAAVLALLAEDVVVLEEGGAERSRDEYAGHHLPADIDLRRRNDRRDHATRRLGSGRCRLGADRGPHDRRVQRPSRRSADRGDDGPSPRRRRLAHSSHPLVVARSALTPTWSRAASERPSPRPDPARRRPPPSRGLC